MADALIKTASLDVVLRDRARWQAYILARVVVTATGCWEWQRSKNAAGYGTCHAGGMNALAHRLAYTAFNDEIPTGHTIDHLCRNRACCNPDPKHLEAVTMKVNTLRGYSPSAEAARKVVCPKGHTFKVAPIGRKNRRWCLECTLASNRRRRVEMRAAGYVLRRRPGTKHGADWVKYG